MTFLGASCCAALDSKLDDTFALRGFCILMESSCQQRSNRDAAKKSRLHALGARERCYFFCGSPTTTMRKFLGPEGEVEAMRITDRTFDNPNPNADRITGVWYGLAAPLCSVRGRRLFSSERR
jgi:hypothetical protein